MKKNILVYGAGLMGRGIAQVFSRKAEHEVFLYDIKDDNILGKVKASLDEFVEKNVISAEKAAAQCSRIHFISDLTESFCKTVDVVVEAVFEDMELKQHVFEKLETLCREDTIFCTNSSVMSPTEISVRIKHVL